MCVLPKWRIHGTNPSYFPTFTVKNQANFGHYALHYMDPMSYRLKNLFHPFPSSLNLQLRTHECQILLNGVVYKLPSCYSIHHRQPNFFDFGYLRPHRTSPKDVATRIHGIFPIKGDETCFPRFFSTQSKRIIWKYYEKMRRKKCLFGKKAKLVVHHFAPMWHELKIHNTTLYIIYFINFSSTKSERSNLFQKALPCNSQYCNPHFWLLLSTGLFLTACQFWLSVVTSNKIGISRGHDLLKNRHPR